MKEVENKKGMYPRVTVFMERTVHLRDYENFKLEAGLSVDVADGETVEDVFKSTENRVYFELKKLTKFVEKHVK